MKRQKMRRRKKDRKVFAKTAGKTKAINISPGEWRGGIKL